MHTIFRLELPDGRGVYNQRCILGYADALEEHSCHPYWPHPSEDDMGTSVWSDMIFGFASLEQMRNWFCGAERLYLSTFGIMLSCYSARGPIVTGRKQVAFYRQAAERLWQRPINHF